MKKMNVFTGGPQVNEKFNESLEHTKEPLKDSNGKKIELDGGGLYPKFKKPENKEEINTKTIRPEEIPQYEETGEENNNINITDKIKKLNEFPIIENLYKSKEISEENFNDLLEQLENSDKNESRELTINFINENLKNSQNYDKINDYFNKTKDIDENNFEQSEFYNKTKGLNIKLDYGIGGLEIMLAENFIDIGGENKDKNVNIRTSMDIVLNKLIDNKNIDFIKNNGNIINDIKNENNINSKYNLLKILHKEYLIDDAKFGGKKGKQEIERNKKSMKEKAEKIVKNKLEINQSNLSEIEKKEKLDKLNIQRRELIKEANELKIKEGDIFKATEEENISESKEK